MQIATRRDHLKATFGPSLAIFGFPDLFNLRYTSILLSILVPPSSPTYSGKICASGYAF